MAKWYAHGDKQFHVDEGSEAHKALLAAGAQEIPDPTVEPAAPEAPKGRKSAKATKESTGGEVQTPEGEGE